MQAFSLQPRFYDDLALATPALAENLRRMGDQCSALAARVMTTGQAAVSAPDILGASSCWEEASGGGGRRQ